MDVRKDHVGLGSAGSGSFPSSLRDELMELGSASLHEARGQLGAMNHSIKPIDPSMRFAGRALTVQAYPGDNLVVHYAITKASPGDVLVVDAQEFMEGGLWGDVLSEAALQAGIVGVVVNGAVRDSGTICALGLPVFSRGLSIKGTAKRQAGKVGIDIICAGTTVRQGDVVVGDRDGVVVVPSCDLERVMDAARARVLYEEKLRDGLRKGRTTVDLMNLGASLDALDMK
jgi:4-hydroxy-4-methyl-2-oxoglutarate aldolase